MSLFLFSVLIVSIASTTIPTTRATARVGEIILNPTHAPPGTLVTFEGVGWDLVPVIGVDGAVFTQCEISGEPVKVDRRYLLCEVKGRGGTYEPVGTFMVADVPAGAYLVSVSAVLPYPGKPRITGEQEFTVDAVTTIATIASTTVTTSPSSYTSRVTTSPTSTPVVTVSATVTTTKVETPQAPDYAVMSLLLSIVTIALVAVLAVPSCGDGNRLRDRFAVDYSEKKDS